MILIPEGDAERSPLSLPAPGCSPPVPQAFPRSAACQALRGLRLSAVRGPGGGCSVLAAAAPAPRALPGLRTSASPALARFPAVLPAPSHIPWQDIHLPGDTQCPSVKHVLAHEQCHAR